jgi:hypothetical protein
MKSFAVTAAAKRLQWRMMALYSSRSIIVLSCVVGPWRIVKVRVPARATADAVVTAARASEAFRSG